MAVEAGSDQDMRGIQPVPGLPMPTAPSAMDMRIGAKKYVDEAVQKCYEKSVGHADELFERLQDMIFELEEKLKK